MSRSYNEIVQCLNNEFDILHRNNPRMAEAELVARGIINRYNAHLENFRREWLFLIQEGISQPNHIDEQVMDYLTRALAMESTYNNIYNFSSDRLIFRRVRQELEDVHRALSQMKADIFAHM